MSIKRIAAAAAISALALVGVAPAAHAAPGNSERAVKVSPRAIDWDAADPAPRAIDWDAHKPVVQRLIDWD